jgi:hypothetical protein
MRIILAPFFQKGTRLFDEAFCQGSIPQSNKGYAGTLMCKDVPNENILLVRYRITVFQFFKFQKREHEA